MDLLVNKCQCGITYLKILTFLVFTIITVDFHLEKL